MEARLRGFELRISVLNGLEGNDESDLQPSLDNPRNLYRVGSA